MWRRSVLLVCTVFGVAACGGGTENGGAESVPLDELAEPLAAALCDVLARCVPIVAADQFPGGCLPYELPRIAGSTVPQLQELVRTGRVKYDAERMPACLALYRTVACGATGADIQACDQAIDGTVAVGGACRIAMECQGNATCDTSASCPGTCVALGGVGAPCVSSTDCESGLTCPLDQVCARRAAKGEACAGPTAQDCISSLACVGETGTAPGTCQEFVQGDVGATCDWNAGMVCKGGLACVALGTAASGSELRQCVAKSVKGGACNTGLQDSCSDGEFCPLTASDRVSGTFSATCQAYGAVGAACGDGTFACGPLGNCSSDGKCVALGRVGDACKIAQDCLTGRCTAGACALNLGCE